MRDVREVIKNLVGRWNLRDPKAMRSAKKADSIHYSVHAAILRRNGGRYLSRAKARVTCSWIEDM